MAAVPQIPKVVVLTLDGDDYSLDALDAAVVPTPGPIVSVKTLDGHKHQDAEAETWALVLRTIVDWDSVRPGLAHYLFTNKDTKVPFVLKWNTDATSTTNPAITGTVTLVAIPYGGAGNAFAEATVVLPIDGDPVVDVTP